MAGRRTGRGGADGERDAQRQRDREARARVRAAAEAERAATDAARRASRTGPDDLEFEPLPSYAAPSTRAGRERQSRFAPAAPAAAPREPKGAADAGTARPTAPAASAEPGERRGRRGNGTGRPERPARSKRPVRARATDAAAGGAARPAAIDAAAIAAWVRTPRGTALAGVAFLALATGVVLGGGGEPEAPQAAANPEAETKPERKSPYGTPTETRLPPATRVVAFTGAPQADELGILGTMSFEKAAGRLDRQAVPYDRKTRPVLRAFDLIATIADADPGPAGKYRTRQTSAVIARYLRAARRHDAALILDVQPGTSNFVDELRPLERWLREPDVFLALDPEWRMRPGVQPGTEIGWVSAGEITATLNRVARIVRANDLPPKLVLVHRFTDGMIRDLDTVDVPKEVVGVISIDGVGSRALKQDTYARIAPVLPEPWLPGFKLFYVEDAEAGGIMSGKQVMALKPRPHVVLYE